MEQSLVLIFLSYLSGSVLYAQVFASIFGKKNLYLFSDDQNPGTVNAYAYGGFWCGTLTLIGDLLKGFLPVWLCLHVSPVLQSWAVPLIIAAPVAGHILPIFHHFRGGKGIATTFGCLLGLLPDAKPLLLFAAAFIIFSTVFRISPNFYRTIAAYACTVLNLLFLGAPSEVCVGFLLIAGLVCARLHASKEARSKVEVRLMRMR